MNKASSQKPAAPSEASPETTEPAPREWSSSRSNLHKQSSPNNQRPEIVKGLSRISIPSTASSPVSSIRSQQQQQQPSHDSLRKLPSFRVDERLVLFPYPPAPLVHSLTSLAAKKSMPPLRIIFPCQPGAPGRMDPTRHLPGSPHHQVVQDDPCQQLHCLTSVQASSTQAPNHDRLPPPSPSLSLSLSLSLSVNVFTWLSLDQYRSLKVM
jgi:hypothetical protein